MTASTYHDRSFKIYYGRLNENRGNGAWCARTASDRTDYLQVDMGAVQSVCAVATQGQRHSHWITSYKVHLSTDGVTWNSYKENNVEKVTRIIYSCLGVAFYSSNLRTLDSFYKLNPQESFVSNMKKLYITSPLEKTRNSCYRLLILFSLKSKPWATGLEGKTDSKMQN